MAYHVIIKQGNLLDHPEADFIVNPSNTFLSLGSGVSGAFAAACGPALQAAMTRKRQTAGRLSKGDVVVTEAAGCPRFRFVLHAAVMDYNPESHETAPTLDTIRTILSRIETVIEKEAVSGKHAVSLVLPMMGTGVGGLDKRDVLNIYWDFFARRVAFECEVTLYAHSEDDRALMEVYFTKI